MSRVFVTVGGQMPFDRLIHLVDGWAETCAHEVFAQTGDHGMRPEHMVFAPTLDPAAYRAAFEGADLIVAHAGMGTRSSSIGVGPVTITGSSGSGTVPKGPSAASVGVLACSFVSGVWSTGRLHASGKGFLHGNYTSSSPG